MAACCRRVWHLLDEAGGRPAVERIEAWADGTASDEEIEALRGVWHNAAAADTRGWRSLLPSLLLAALEANHWQLMEWAGLLVACDAAGFPPDWEVTGSRSQDPAWRAAREREEREHAGLLREIFGNPFRPVVFDPAWQTPSVLNLARSMYQERSFDRMPLLADALTDAGCTHAEVLGHCRLAQKHVRGCWVADLVLQKE
jgi:hypothetical protein